MIGVLAIQGNFESHESRLLELGAACRRVNKTSDLDGLTGLVIPGGESSVLLRLSRGEFRDAMARKIAGGLPVLATCAGLILLASKVENPEQESIAALDLDVRRNAYGRQVDSFITPSLDITPDGLQRFEKAGIKLKSNKLEGVFIRAPKITRLGKGVQTLVTHDGQAVLAAQGNILAASFHPELSKQDTIHRLFLAECQ